MDSTLLLIIILMDLMLTVLLVKFMCTREKQIIQEIKSDKEVLELWERGADLAAQNKDYP
jgi:hypothetical protein